MSRIVWWITQCLLVLLASFFLLFGISHFIAAYRLNDPFSFIMTVFGSNLMILISAVLLVGFVLRMINVYRLLKKDRRQEKPDQLTHEDEDQYDGHK